MKSEVRTRLEQPVDPVRAQRQVLLAALLGGGGTALLVRFPWLADGLGSWSGLAHLLIAFWTVALAVHIVAMAWTGLSHSAVASANALIIGFTVIAGLDVLHGLREHVVDAALAGGGGPGDLLWLASDVAQLSVIALLLRRARLSGSRALWCQQGLVLVVLIALITDRAAAELAVDRAGVLAVTLTIVGFALGAIGLSRRFVREREVADLWLALSCGLAALEAGAAGMLSVGSEASVLPIYLLRLMSYASVHRAVFLNGFQSPLRRLLHSESRYRQSEAELQNVLDSVPSGLCRFDSNLQLRYANQTFRSLMQIDAPDLVGLKVGEIFDPKDAPGLMTHLHAAMDGARVEFDMTIRRTPGDTVHHRHVVLAPTRHGDGSFNGVLAVVSDVTDRELARRRAAESAREILEIKAALDEHAIVAFTDSRGVIKRVNDKFCSISQYSREELVGRTHRIINSGHHPKGFFAEMWKTISRGEVWNGEVCNRAKDGSQYWVQTTIVPLLGPQGTPEQYIAIRADITKRKQAEADAQRMALHDSLTGLPNRRLMGDRLQHALHAARREGQHGALLLLDMDNFKDVNDSLGHAMGDQLLCQIAWRLAACVRATDTVARLGGDEFVVILERLDEDLSCATDKTLSLGNKIREELCVPYEFGPTVINISPSIGITLFDAESPEPDELVKRADMALYKAKEQGRNCVAFFDPRLQAEINARAELLRELRLALANDELRLYYQPVVDAEMRIRGVEALLRWHSARLGMVSPGQFIPLAEQSSLILPIGQWVIDEACAQLARWAADPKRSDWTISVNVSAKQFHDDAFVDNVTGALAASGARGDRLRVEITESMMHVNLRETAVKMKTLKARGVLFSLDDFGTGYSSLSYLKTLPLDQLKIDRSFVADILTDPNDAAIIRTILALADHLSLDVVAEGVETVEQKGLLMSYGCRTYQGFLFGKPVPVEALQDEIEAVRAARLTVEQAQE